MHRLFLVVALAAVSVDGGLTVARAESGRIVLDQSTREKCLHVLRAGLRGDEFWPSMHAAEGLTVGGCGSEVSEYLAPRLSRETDLQKRCGLARELARAGDRAQARVLLEILSDPDPHGHVHAAESLYKIAEIGDGRLLRQALTESQDVALKLMSAAALGRCGNPAALKYIRETLQHQDPAIFTVAAWVIGVLGSADDLPVLRQQLDRCPDAGSRGYVENAMALLGDAESRRTLRKNLSSGDPAVRTYAANFAADAGAVDSAATLIRLLDDAVADVRIRAAHSLLALAASAEDPGADLSRIVFVATPPHPRYTEGSVIELRDGTLLFAITEFGGDSGDFARAQIVARRSADGGRTWGESSVLQENTGGLNVMSVTLRRSGTGQIMLYYLEKNSLSDLDLKLRFSDDEAASFGEPVLITQDPGYHVVNNDRITRLTSGRLVVPAASTLDVEKVNHFVAHCYLSDDDGKTWRPGSGRVDAPNRGAMEPEVVELGDGRLLMIIRNQVGFIGRSYSTDSGDTWSEMESLGLRSPEAPATIRRVPATGDLLLIWNDVYTAGAPHGGRRTPLSAAISQDDGLTWRTAGVLEDNPDLTFSYVSVAFIRDRAVLSYWEGDRSDQFYSGRFRSVPVSWFYRSH